MGWSRSRSRSRSRGRRSRSRSRSRSPEGTRVHVANLGIDCSKNELEKHFERFGKLLEVWVARNPPCFSFIVFQYREDAEEAIKEMDGKALCGGRIRVTCALPRSRGRRRRGFDPNLRCYNCGERGHFSRDCMEMWHSRRRRHSRSFSRSESRSPSRHHDRRRSGGTGGKNRRSRSRSPSRERRSRSNDRKRSRKESHKSNRSRSKSPVVAVVNGSPKSDTKGSSPARRSYMKSITVNPTKVSKLHY